jgi:hypothetical protein
MPQQAFRVVFRRGDVEASVIRAHLLEFLREQSLPIDRRAPNGLDARELEGVAGLPDFDPSSVGLVVAEDSQGSDGQLSQIVLEYLVQVSATATPAALYALWVRWLKPSLSSRLGSETCVGEDVCREVLTETEVIDLRVEIHAERTVRSLRSGKGR